MPTRVSDDISAFSSSGTFAGFEAADFDAYEQKKWSSNAYTLARRRAKDKLNALAHAVKGELDEELAPFELLGSDEAPTVANARKVEAQWAFFIRGAESRAALKPLLYTTDLQAGLGLFDIAVQHQHACLVLRLSHDGLSVGIEIASKAKVDRDNVAQKLAQSWARDKLVELCGALPGGARIGVDGDMHEAIDLKAVAIEAWAEPLTAGKGLFATDSLISRDEPMMSSDLCVGTVVELVSVFLPLCSFLAWSRDNDYTQLKEALKKTADDKQKRAPAMKPGDRVTILSGLFSGRPGYLAEIDAKGRAKVMVGPVSVSVDGKDIKPA